MTVVEFLWLLALVLNCVSALLHIFYDGDKVMGLINLVFICLLLLIAGD